VRIPTRVAQTRLLLRPALKTIRWAPLILIVGIGFLVVWSGLRHDGDASVKHLPMAGGLLAVWMGFLLDDPAAESVASVPFTVVSRRGVRILVAVPVVGLAWVLLSLQADVAARWATLTTAFAAQLLVALGCAAIGAKVLGPGRGGPVAAAGLFLVFVVLPLVFKVPLTLDLLTDSWNNLYGRSLLSGAVGFVTFLGASADPGRRGLVAWLRGASTRPMVAAREPAP